MISNKEIKPETVLSAYETACSMMIENINCYCALPNIDFTRKRKITVKNILDFLLALGSKATRSEICEFFTDDDPPTDSAMYLQRCKLNSDAVRSVLELFSKQFTAEKNFMGYQVLSCDVLTLQFLVIQLMPKHWYIQMESISIRIILIHSMMI